MNPTNLDGKVIWQHKGLILTSGSPNLTWARRLNLVAEKTMVDIYLFHPKLRERTEPEENFLPGDSR